MREPKQGKRPERDAFTRLTFLQTGLCILIAAFVFAAMTLRPAAFEKLSLGFSEMNAADYGQEPIRFFDIGSRFEKREETASSSEPEPSDESAPSVEATTAQPDVLPSEDVNGESDASPALFAPATLLTPVALSTAEGGPVLPVVGRVTSGYGERLHPFYGETRFHGGVDLGAEEGAPVLAALDGVVVGAGVGEMSGNYVKLSHDGGRETLYCHLSKINVEKGVAVRAGDVIGFVGHTGMATGPHLHFELHVNGEKTDPTDFLREAADAAALR